VSHINEYSLLTEIGEKMAAIQQDIHVLIVDDVPQVRQGLASTLTLATKNEVLKIAVVGEAQNGFEAVEKAQAYYPDVVLMDLEMPLMDGYQATHSIKSTNPSIFIVILSIHTDPASRRNALQAGADAFVDKGAPLKELLQAIYRRWNPS
jgi:DNA-binding NarL/FixJ family response regulator